jgi:hypothetical protein
MEKERLLAFRQEALKDSTDSKGVLSQELYLDEVLPGIVEAKLLDSEVLEYTFFEKKIDDKKLKINAYTINETGERLQLFIVDDKALDLATSDEDLIIGKKPYYDDLFAEAENFVLKSIKRHLTTQDSDPAGFIVGKLGESSFLDKIDVIEIFALSPSIPISPLSKEFSLKKHEFKNTTIKTKLTLNKEIFEKEILLIKQLITLDKHFSFATSSSSLEPVVVDTLIDFGSELEVLKAADEVNFESYLCVIPGAGLANLYKTYSTRLLERNVRSFLQFKGVNAGMRKTIEKTPERFIAYNNGLTITASEREIELRDGKLMLKSLTDFQIVNGGQTTASIYFSQKGIQNKKKLDISKVNLMAKINIAKNLSEEEVDELIGDISLYSNSQSKVSNVDKKVSNPRIAIIKSLSDSILTPKGDKWYFEKMKGEFKTMILLKGWDKKKSDREYPKGRRLTKTEIGKYYTAWGDKPWLVKKGGEKVFADFINTISGNGDEKMALEINRTFYEELIAKSILFRELEELHGARTKAIGQLRSAAVPYTLSVIFKLFGGTANKTPKFSLSKVWKEQGVSESLSEFCMEIMKEMYVLIQKYKTSDDSSENTKKEELWIAIRDSSEIKALKESENAKKIIKEYVGTNKTEKQDAVVKFDYLLNVSECLIIGKKIFNDLLSNFNYELSSTEQRKIPNYLSKIFPKKGEIQDIPIEGVEMLSKLIKLASVSNPELISDIESNQKSKVALAVKEIISIYNRCIEDGLNIESEFQGHESKAQLKNYKYTGVINIIGKKISNGEAPNLEEVVMATDYFSRTHLK